jgi:hypothetical protein
MDHVLTPPAAPADIDIQKQARYFSFRNRNVGSFHIRHERTRTLDSKFTTYYLLIDVVEG